VLWPPEKTGDRKTLRFWLKTKEWEGMAYAFGPGRKLSQLAASIDFYRAAHGQSQDIITVFSIFG
jgi:hypothetical protein